MKKAAVDLIRSSQFPEKAYVGSSVNVFKRLNDHFSALGRGKHHSVIMQNHVNKYGLSDLYVSKVKFCEPSVLRSLEQRYLTKYKPFFNVSTLAVDKSPHILQAGIRIRIQGKAKQINRLRYSLVVGFRRVKALL